MPENRPGRIPTSIDSDYRNETPRTREATLALGEQFTTVLAAAQQGAPWAFEHMYATLSPAVGGYLRAQRAAEPEDLTSEVFLGVFRGIGAFAGSEEQFRSWVFTIAHRRLQDERRRIARAPHFTDDKVEVTGGDVEHEALAALGEQWVLEISAQLSADQRTVLLLRTVADLTAEQVAQIMGKSEGAVRALQRRALSALRRHLSRQNRAAGVRL